MDAMRAKISAKTLKAMVPDTAGKKDTFLWDTELTGFGVKLTPAGRRSFILQYRTGGRGSPTKRYVIDPRGVLAAEQARDMARELLVEVSKGGDPATERANGKLRTVADLIDAFEASRKTKGNRSAVMMAKLLRRELLASWGHRPAVDIRRADVKALLGGIVDRGHPQTANKLRRVIHAMFAWALAGEQVRINPVAGVDAPGSENSRDRVLSDAELAEVWSACGSLSSAGAAAVRLMILTAQRRTEVGGLMHLELDIPGAVWTIEGARSKNGQRDLTQLSPQAVAIVAGMPRFKDCPYLLTNDGKRPIGGWSKLKTALDKAIMEARQKAAIAAGRDAEPMPHWTLHDLRRTAATGMGALGVAPHIIDRVLHHSKKRRGILATYDRFEYFAERRDALVRWGARVDALVTPAASQSLAAE